MAATLGLLEILRNEANGFRRECLRRAFILPNEPNLRSGFSFTKQSQWLRSASILPNESNVLAGFDIPKRTQTRPGTRRAVSLSRIAVAQWVGVLFACSFCVRL